MRKSYLFCAIMPLALIACNQENELSLQEGTTTEAVQDVDYFSDPNNQLLQNNNNELTLQQTAPPALSNTAPNNSAPNPNVKLNPEHGMPGHRCEIPVGAPLNSPPQQAVAPAAAPASGGGGNGIQLSPQSMQQPSPVSVQPAKTESSTPPSLSQSKQVRLNPEHGQPGHKCEIPVGSPLPD